MDEVVLANLPITNNDTFIIDIQINSTNNLYTVYIKRKLQS